MGDSGTLFRRHALPELFLKNITSKVGFNTGGRGFIVCAVQMPGLTAFRLTRLRLGGCITVTWCNRFYWYNRYSVWDGVT